MQLKNRTLLAAVAAGTLTAPAALGEGTDVAGPTPVPSVEPSRFHITLGADLTTAYFFRGIRQEDSGFIAQPYADAALDVYRQDDTTVSIKAGVWNSLHGEATGASTGDSAVKNWYECDVYAGLGVVVGKWSFDARYVLLTSPSDAFGTVDEVDFSVAFDDTELMGKWSLKPAATLVIETGSNATDGGRRGTYLQLGVSPGVTFDADSIKNLALTFPVTVGLSLGNYYEGGGDNEAFGFASVGAKASAPLPLDSSWGAWTLNAGVQVLFLGDAAASFNSGDHEQVIATVGISATF
jgi:hypothetical protein